MKYEVQLEDLSGRKSRIVELERNGGGSRVQLDGQPIDADAVGLAPYTLSILLNGQSYEIRVTPTPEGKLKIQTRTHQFSAEVIDPRSPSGRPHGHLQTE